MKTCSFFGHRDIAITHELTNKLKTVIEHLIKNENFTVFYFGELGDFDNICYEIVTELKTTYMQIERIYVAPDEKKLSLHRRRNIKSYEKRIVLPVSFSWWYKIIYYRNLSIIDNSDFIIFYVTENENSGAYKAMQYAIKSKKRHLNIAVDELNNENYLFTKE